LQTLISLPSTRVLTEVSGILMDIAVNPPEAAGRRTGFHYFLAKGIKDPLSPNAIQLGSGLAFLI